MTELIAKRTSVVQNGIEHTAAAFEVAALPGDSPSRFGKEPFENPTRALFVRELDAVGIVGMAVAADLQRWKAGLPIDRLDHHLIDRDS